MLVSDRGGHLVCFMLRRLTQVLLAFIVALAATMPAHACAMPMRQDMTGTAIQRMPELPGPCLHRHEP